MSIVRAVKQGSIELKRWIIQFRKYKTMTIINEIAGPLFGGVSTLLLGRFVGSVLYAGKEIPYAEFLAVSTAAAFIYMGILRIFEPSSNSWTKKRDIIFVDNIPVFMLTIEFWFILFASVQAVFWLIPIVIATGIPITEPLLAYFVANIALTPSIAAIGFTLSGIGLRIRGKDAWAIRSITTKILRLIIPTSFAVSAYGPLAKYMLWIPTVAAMEGVRQLIFGLPGAPTLIAYALTCGTILASVAYLFFKHMFWKARLKGWILLE